jgi:hypothetical protein
MKRYSNTHIYLKWVLVSVQVYFKKGYISFFSNAKGQKLSNFN